MSKRKYDRLATIAALATRIFTPQQFGSKKMKLTTVENLAQSNQQSNQPRLPRSYEEKEQLAIQAGENAAIRATRAKLPTEQVLVHRDEAYRNVMGRVRLTKFDNFLIAQLTRLHVPPPSISVIITRLRNGAENRVRQCENLRATETRLLVGTLNIRQLEALIDAYSATKCDYYEFLQVIDAYITLTDVWQNNPQFKMNLEQYIIRNGPAELISQWFAESQRLYHGDGAQQYTNVFRMAMAWFNELNTKLSQF